MESINTIFLWYVSMTMLYKLIHVYLYQMDQKQRHLMTILEID